MKHRLSRQQNIPGQPRSNEKREEEQEGEDRRPINIDVFFSFFSFFVLFVASW
ncbi:MAG: hypothetical protein HYR56_10660 [Acidobacteria bacterium]|nr:hypothetical protein [Acidobacteriota bacterium]MBI3424080.1 hypothetical protein [Acidobacteriota bacterium]